MSEKNRIVWAKLVLGALFTMVKWYIFEIGIKSPMQATTQYLVKRLI
jgi:hypothetical protein